jgi:hypothetical protein
MSLISAYRIQDVDNSKRIAGRLPHGTDKRTGDEVARAGRLNGKRICTCMSKRVTRDRGKEWQQSALGAKSHRKS